LPARIVSAEAFGVASVENRKTILFVKPIFRPKSETWMDRKSRRQSEASVFSYVPKSIKFWPRTFGVYVVSRNG
jgi:hypothetical protein